MYVREREYRPGPPAIGFSLLMVALGLSCLFIIPGFGDLFGAAVNGVFLAVGFSGLHNLMRALRCRVWISDDGIRGRSMWGREVAAGWSEVRAMLWCGYDGDTEAEHRHLYEIDTVHGSIQYDSGFAGFSQIERIVRERSGAPLYAMPWHWGILHRRESSLVAVVTVVVTVGVWILSRIM